MFDELIRQLEQLEKGTSLAVEIPLDEDGYFDRLCPSNECQFQFKILFQDWKDKVSDEHVYCPLCKHDNDSGEWNTLEQTEYLENQAVAHISGVINDAIRKDAHRFNRQQKPGFIQLSLSVKPGEVKVVLPVEAAKALQQKLACEVCDCHYAVIGAAFFCPACGHNSVVSTFDKTLETVREIVSKTSEVRRLLTSSFDIDTAQNTIRSTLEDSMTRLVGAFQQFSEALFNNRPNASTIKQPKNVFQRLTDASELWRTATGKGYDNLLTTSELSELKELFQKRHLITHRNGIVDQEYIDKSGDRTYSIGQRLVIKEATVLRLATILEKLSNELRKLP